MIFLFLFLFTKMMFVFFLVGIKLAYLYKSQYHAIFKFVNTHIVWSNYYTTLIALVWCISMTYRKEIFCSYKPLLQLPTLISLLDFQIL